MILQTGKNNRLLVYFFYDKAGVVDDYILYMLEKMKPHVRDILFVSNGRMTADSLKKAQSHSDHVIERENKGMDVMAYKAAIDYMGWEKLAGYDELIMMNFTIMGPVTSLGEMFADMDSRDIDFWGLTLFHGCDGDPFGADCEYGYLPMHIQSHFIAVRNDMLISDDFKSYWENRPEIKYYSDAIGKHEAIFTKRFGDLGYKWDVYSDTRDCMEYTDLPIISMPVKLIRDKKCPIFKRRNFFQEYFDILNKSTGEIEVQLYEYLREHTDYNLDYIWDNMLRVQNIADIKKALQLNYVVSTKALEHTGVSGSSVVFIVFVSDVRNLYNNYKYLENIPKEYHIVVYAESDEAAEAFQEKIRPDAAYVVHTVGSVKHAADRLALVKNASEGYDIMCLLNDFRESVIEFDSINESFLYRCYATLVYNEKLIRNIVGLFADNERLGMLVPPPPNHADYYPTLGCFDWGDNFDETSDIAEMLDIKSDINRNKEPVAAYGHMFFARTSSLQKILEYDWSRYDVKQNTDLAIERLYSFAAQDCGFYTAGIMSDVFAAIETTNLQYMLTEVNRQAFALFGLDGHFNLVNKMREFLGAYGDCDPSSIEVRLIRIIRKIIPRGLMRLMGKICRTILKLFRRK